MGGDGSNAAFILWHRGSTFCVSSSFICIDNSGPFLNHARKISTPLMSSIPGAHGWLSTSFMYTAFKVGHLAQSPPRSVSGAQLMIVYRWSWRNWLGHLSVRSLLLPM